MVVVNILGGLGNQMFQYAFARSICKKFDTEIKFSTDMNKLYYPNRKIDIIKAFNIDFNSATKNDLNILLGSFCALPTVRRALNGRSMSFIRPKSFVLEPSFAYCDDFPSNINGNAYLQGYWQSHKYFIQIEDEIRRAFKFSSELSPRDSQMARRILSSNSVSIHVRRGDYVTNKKANHHHGLCSIDYYSAAIRHMLYMSECMEFFVFTDDENWVMNNIMDLHPNLNLANSKDDITGVADMQLMSMCAHNIIANSTFSWWGAWLNNNQNKVVVTPKRWFANDSRIDDLIPKDWIQI